MKNPTSNLFLSFLFLASTYTMYGQAIPSDPDFIGKEMLGRPTDNSITINFVPRSNMEAFIEYGTSSDNLPSSTATFQIDSESPFETVLTDLQPNTAYYYRLQWKNEGNDSFTTGDTHSFHTARDVGEEFVFTVQSDLHLDDPADDNTDRQVLLNCFENQIADNPDFAIDMGDTFMSDKLESQYGLEINYENVKARHLEVRQFFNELGDEVPFFIALGNHEAELGWLLDGTEDNLAVWATNIRKEYYLNPTPDDFYSGSTTIEDHVGVREGYYAFHWGDALLVILDPYWYTQNKPGQTLDIWDWTLGKEQYDWLKNTLEESEASFKFVFSHHLVGGNTEGRGGIEFADWYEWGGHDEDGNYLFDEKRPGWGKPIHELFKDNDVSAFFHGHDHFYCKQEKDGVIYQGMPQPSHPKLKSSVGNAEDYGYLEGVLLPSSGHLRVTVNPTGATIDYVKAYLDENETDNRQNGDVAYSYSIQPSGEVISSVNSPKGFLANSFESIYPNPADNVVTLEVSLVKADKAYYHLISTTGKEVMKGDLGWLPQGKSTTQINLDTIDPGQYILMLQVEEYFEGKNIIIK